jgi:hypothetical protein
MGLWKESDDEEDENEQFQGIDGGGVVSRASGHVPA